MVMGSATNRVRPAKTASKTVNLLAVRIDDYLLLLF